MAAPTEPDTTSPTRPSRPRRALRKALFASVAFVALLALLEGLCSLALVTHDLVRFSEVRVAERQHTIHDPDLGWVNQPSLRLADFYGEGRSLTINARGFRGAEEHTAETPAGRRRLVLSGDSFVLGYGVDDSETLGASLERLEPTLQVVNMGQGGYGLDQVYLWYQRDGADLQHQVHVFAFIYDDLVRMQSDVFHGYPKPYLELREEVLVAAGTPVPERAYWVPWVTDNIKLIRRLRLVELPARLLSSGRQGPPRARHSLEESVALAVRAIETMHAADLARGSRLVVVWLPLADDVEPGKAERLRHELFAYLRSRDILAADLVADFRRAQRPPHPELFLREHGAWGHYSAHGNEFFAGLLMQRLRTMPELGLDDAAGTE